MTQIENCLWFPFNDEPLLKSTWYVPKFCDPQVIMPSFSPDKRWHLFFHSWIGIHHFSSSSGIAWEPEKMIVPRGHYPNVFIEYGKYYLVYEKHDLSFSGKLNKSNFRIEIRSSEDLVSWTSPKVVLTASQVPYAKDYLGSAVLSRPQIVKTNEEFRLYFGASEAFLPDSKQRVSRYLGYAQCFKLGDEFFVPENSLVLEPEPDDKWSNLAAGSVKIFKNNGLYYAVQCCYYWDEEEKQTLSAAFLLKSPNGLKFIRCSDKPIIFPLKNGWAGRYIKSCDVNYKEDERCFYCYFSANNCTNSRFVMAKESVGLFIGQQ